MDILNHTPYRAQTSLALRPQGYVVVTVLKSTFDIGKDGELVPASEQFDLVTDPVQTPFGILSSDLVFRKRGCDLCIMGAVSRTHPVKEAHLSLQVGDKTISTLRVRGAQTWQVDEAGELMPTEPEPFTHLPLSYDRAFGGQQSFEDHTSVLDPRNPSGVGCYTRKDQAKGRALAQITNGQPYSRWDQRLEVVGWGPYFNAWALRADRHLELDMESGKIVRVDPAYFNHAHPDLMLDKAPLGECIKIEGMRERPMFVSIQRLAAQICVRFDHKHYDLRSELDGIYIWPDASKVVITQRARLVYEHKAQIQRQIVIQETQPNTPVGHTLGFMPTEACVRLGRV